MAIDDAEHQRLSEANDGSVAWRDWGPYVAERAWGSVREDYSADGDAWASFPHDHARSRTYRWNEDGMAGFCDLDQKWCLGLALHNGVDPILKERMFGLTGPQGNHGEDAKEYWWYLDGTPTHSFNTWRYHYPQAEFPYNDLIETNANRSKTEQEYELVDTGIFDDSRYWVVTVDYAKQGAHDLLMQITVENAGPDAATIEVLPTLWYRNTWSWGYANEDPKPALTWEDGRVVGRQASTGTLYLQGEGSGEAGAGHPLFCDNETNTARIYGETTSELSAYPKDGINDFIVNGAATVNPELTGTKAALHYSLTLQPGETRVIRVRLTGEDDAEFEAAAETELDTSAFDGVVDRRHREADAFYAELTPEGASADEARVLRQAFAGLLWSKQFFHFNVQKWLDGDPATPPPPPERAKIRNGSWRHLDAHDVILMPDPWEYPWFAAWDLAFHCVTLAHIDPEFAKAQLILMLREWYMHPSGQLPAYEWNFSDVNPPTHAWAALHVFLLDGGTDYSFLARVFHKLLMNFTWWTNNKDHGENNLFEGGFMGLDNIAPLDRSKLPPEVGILEQADSTAWMAMYALDLLNIALRLAGNERSYEDVATKFIEHFLQIANSANATGMWDDEDAFFYDMLHLADGRDVPMKVRSLVGLVPVVASLVFDNTEFVALPEFRDRVIWFLSNHPEMRPSLHMHDQDGKRIFLLALVSPDRLKRILAKVFNEQGMLSDHGIRGISAYHKDHPFSVEVNGLEAVVDYEPAESTSGLFGGNSNWRGPVWFPLNVLFVEALRNYGATGSPTTRVEFPLGSGTFLTFDEAADQLSGRLISLFTPGPDGRRPSDARYDLLSTDPRWRDNIFFYEYFDGDTGQGLGASHQTGWTALVAHLILTRGDRAGDGPAANEVVPDGI
ncbi:MGH1-like glycoside hydrolase domain-containing protein [Subtercola endophyticus]|uniref:MGH1-like glycoside hydrolase domain-containing protein n=1 Tax=Subtercola endophyticus TaxID=2895559 RepID=UPI001E36E0AA|nr:glucosidase [Subtercola endophyticus]UFS60245.1 glucosidase [Subtercola endophyticus]